MNVFQSFINRGQRENEKNSSDKERSNFFSLLNWTGRAQDKFFNDGEYHKRNKPAKDRRYNPTQSDEEHDFPFYSCLFLKNQR